MTAKKKTRGKALKTPPKRGPTPAQVQAFAEEKAARELVELYANVVNPKPHLDCRIFPLPDYCSVSSVAMRELDGEDDILSSYWADQHATAVEQDSATAAAVADHREGIRISLVAVEGRQVNEDGIPYMACDPWTSKTWRFLAQAFGELNGVSQEDLKNAVRGSQSLTKTSAHGESEGAQQDEE